jgi:hypothetical protein
MLVISISYRHQCHGHMNMLAHLYDLVYCLCLFQQIERLYMRTQRMSIATNNDYFVRSTIGNQLIHRILKYVTYMSASKRREEMSM